MRHTLPTLLVILSAGGLLTSMTSFADNKPAGSFYRYTMPDGRTEVGRQVPAAAVKNGYEVLDKKMRLIRKVRPALTQQERADKEALKRKQESDEKLLQTFATSEDAERARDRKIAALDVIVNISKGTILRLNLEYETLAGVAATKMRKGEPVPLHVETSMKSIERQIGEAEGHIEAKEKEKQAIYESYKPDIDRLKELEAR